MTPACPSCSAELSFPADQHVRATCPRCGASMEWTPDSGFLWHAQPDSEGARSEAASEAKPNAETPPPTSGAAWEFRAFRRGRKIFVVHERGPETRVLKGSKVCSLRDGRSAELERWRDEVVMGDGQVNLSGDQVRERVDAGGGEYRHRSSHVPDFDSAVPAPSVPMREGFARAVPWALFGVMIPWALGMTLFTLRGGGGEGVLSLLPDFIASYSFAIVFVIALVMWVVAAGFHAGWVYPGSLLVLPIIALGIVGRWDEWPVRIAAVAMVVDFLRKTPRFKLPGAAVALAALLAPFAVLGYYMENPRVQGLSPESALETARELATGGDVEAALDTLSSGGVTATLSGDLDALELLLTEMENVSGS